MILTAGFLGIDCFNNFSDFYCFAFRISVRDVISAFRLIALLTSLKKMNSELSYGTLNFMNIHYSKVYPIHS